MANLVDQNLSSALRIIFATLSKEGVIAAAKSSKMLAILLWKFLINMKLRLGNEKQNYLQCNVPI